MHQIHPSPAPPPHLRPRPADQLRRAAAARVDATSLRGAAREIGMSPTGLRKFLDGTTPHAVTLRRLRTWYLHHASASAGALSHTDAAVALAVLTQGLPPGLRRELAGAVLDALARAYDASRLPPPSWIEDLRTEHGASA